MDDILTYLEELTYPDPLLREYFAVLRNTDPLTKVIQEKLSLGFLDGLTSAQGEVTKWERQEAFSRGFRLGAQLTLAGIQPSL